METQETDAWALDVSRLESSEVIESLSHASSESGMEFPNEQGAGGDGLAGGRTGADDDRAPGRVEMDAQAPVSEGGMGLSDQEINNGAGEIFSGAMKLLSGAVGQDLTPDENEKKEAGKKLGPVVQKRFPTVRRYTPETALTIWLFAYLNDKTDTAQLLR
jgi:hypothetical protein